MSKFIRMQTSEYLQNQVEEKIPPPFQSVWEQASERNSIGLQLEKDYASLKQKDADDFKQCFPSLSHDN